MAPRRTRAFALWAALLTALPWGALVPHAAASANDAPLELVIAPDSFIEELQPLRAWRESQGLRVDIVSTTFVHAQMAGRDLQESIKAYIASRRASDPRLEYVLLAADDPIIPSRLLHVANRTAFPSVAAEDRALASDFYFAAEGASFFNASDLGDDYPAGLPWYGISDDTWNLSATVHVGRIPARNESELAAYITKLLAWERSPPQGPWASRAVMGLAVASVPDGTFASRRAGDDASAVFAPAESAAVQAGVLNQTLRDYPAFPVPYDAGADTLDAPTFVGEWGLGATLVVLAARDSPLQGGPGEAYAGDGSSSVFSPVATVASIDSLSNGARLPVFVAAYGGSANVSALNDSAAERAVRSGAGGAAVAVGFAGRTAAGTAPGSPQGGWTLAAAVVREMYERPGTLGAVVDRARERFVSDAQTAMGGAFDLNNASLRRALAGLTVIGDPASVPWTRAPRAVDVTLPAGIAPNAAVQVRAAVASAGVPLEGATVAVMDETGSLMGVGTTNATGVALVAVVTGGRASWNVTVTAPGYGFAQRALAVDAPPAVAIVTPAQGSAVAGQVDFTGVAGDPDPGDNVTAVEVSLNGGAWVAAQGASSWTFGVDTLGLENGANTFSARASDGTVWSDPLVVSFNVTNARPPGILAPYPTIAVNEDNSTTFPLDLRSHFAPTGPTATLSAEVLTTDRLALNLTGEALRIVPAPDANGPMAVALRVIDSYGGDVRLNLSVSVLAVDDPPSLTVAASFQIEEGGTAVFDPIASDPDGTFPNVYVESGPENATATSWQAPRGALGDYLIVLAATDGRFVVTRQIVVTVASHNSPPSANISAPDRAEAGREVRFAAVGLYDRDGDPVVVRWDFADGQGAQGEDVAHVYAAQGTYTVTLNLSDGRQSVEIRKVIVIDPYQPPGTPPQGYAAAIAYGSIAVILASAALATYLLFFRAPAAGAGTRSMGAKDPRAGRRDREEE